MIATPSRQGARTRRIRNDLLSLGFLVLAAAPTQASLLVSNHNGCILRYNGSTGAFLEAWTPDGGGGSATISGLAFSQNNVLYIGCPDTNSVMRLDLGFNDFQGGNNNGGGNGNGGGHHDGGFGGPFATGGSLSPAGLVVGQDGSLYVSNTSNNEVRRYDGDTGFYFGPFAFGGGLTGPAGVTFGPDNNLYVASNGTNAVIRFNGQTGLPVDSFVPPGSGGLDHPVGLTFGPDGNLYVASSNTNSVIRYNGTTGASMGTFASGGGLISPAGLTFGPDGNLYVASRGTDTVLRYNGTTGAFLNTFVAPGSGGLTGANVGLVFTPLKPTEGLSTTVISSSQVSLSWIDNNDDETGYNIWRSTNGNSWTQIGNVGPNTTTYTDSGLTANTFYQYQVQAVNRLYTSPWGQSQDVVIRVPPSAAPSGLGGNAISNTQINLTWTDNSNNETAFTLWRRVGTGAWARLVVLGPNTITYSDTGLTPNTSYSYRVRAINSGAASSWSNEVTLTTPP